MRKKPQALKNAADKVVKNIRLKPGQTYSYEEKIRTALAGLRDEEGIAIQFCIGLPVAASVQSEAVGSAP